MQQSNSARLGRWENCIASVPCGLLTISRSIPWTNLDWTSPHTLALCKAFPSTCIIKSRCWQKRMGIDQAGSYMAATRDKSCQILVGALPLSRSLPWHSPGLQKAAPLSLPLACPPPRLSISTSVLSPAVAAAGWFSVGTLSDHKRVSLFLLQYIKLNSMMPASVLPSSINNMSMPSCPLWREDSILGLCPEQKLKPGISSSIRCTRPSKCGTLNTSIHAVYTHHERSRSSTFD